MINKPPALYRDFNRVQALKRRRFIDHGSTLEFKAPSADLAQGASSAESIYEGINMLA